MICWREWSLITWQDGPGAVLFLSGLSHATPRPSKGQQGYMELLRTIAYAEIEWANYQISYDSSLFRLGAATFRLSKSEWNFLPFVWESSDGKFAFWLDAIKSVEMGSFTGQAIARGKVLIGEQEGGGIPKRRKIALSDELLVYRCGRYPFQIHTSTHCTTRNARMEENAIPCMRPTVCTLGPSSGKIAKAKGEVSLSWPSSLSIPSKWH